MKTLLLNIHISSEYDARPECAVVRLTPALAGYLLRMVYLTRALHEAYGAEFQQFTHFGPVFLDDPHIIPGMEALLDEDDFLDNGRLVIEHEFDISEKAIADDIRYSWLAATPSGVYWEAGYKSGPLFETAEIPADLLDSLVDAPPKETAAAYEMTLPPSVKKLTIGQACPEFDLPDEGRSAIVFEFDGEIVASGRVAVAPDGTGLRIYATGHRDSVAYIDLYHVLDAADGPACIVIENGDGGDPIAFARCHLDGVRVLFESGVKLISDEGPDGPTYGYPSA